MHRNTITLFAVSFTLGCGAPVATEGDWKQLAIKEVIKDECNFEPSVEDAIIELESTDDGFLIDGIACVTAGADFTCEEISNSEDMSGLSLDATVTTSALLIGTVDSETLLTVNVTYSITCDGPDCDAAAEFYAQNDITVPCTTQWIVETQLVE